MRNLDVLDCVDVALTRGVRVQETSFKLYKRFSDDNALAQVLVDWLYDRFRKDQR